MNTLAIITKVELKKLFQRKDSWLMFAILCKFQSIGASIPELAVHLF